MRQLWAVGPRASTRRSLVERGGGLFRNPTVVAALVVVVVLAAALTVRLVNLTRFGLNSDEAVYSGQSAALAGDQRYAELFGVFRAHPLLVHVVLSLVYRVTGVNDVAPRLVCVAAGVLLVLTAGVLTRIVYGRLAGVLAAIFVAVCPYAVIVSRQMLLDGPMALFFALTLVFLALYVHRPRRSILLAAAAAAGLAFLAKETAILIVPAAVVFLLLARQVKVRALDLLWAGAVFLVTIAPFPLALLLAGGTRTGQAFFVYQLFRRANHSAAFYLTDVAPQVSVPILALGVLGAVLALRRRSSLDILLLCFTIVPLLFFELWPVKGFQYVIPIITPIAALAADALVWTLSLLRQVTARLPSPQFRPAVGIALGLAVVFGCIGVSLNQSAQSIGSPRAMISATDSADGDAGNVAVDFTAGTGGLEAARPVGQWVEAHTLPDAQFLTIGSSFANVIQFYGLRRALALSVSPNPLHRNPSYIPVVNPDKLIRTGAIQYLVYDAYSAARTTFFSSKLTDYVKKYHGIPVYSFRQSVGDAHGANREVATVTIYVVHP